ncbi:MAG: BMP family ABC transporter substrate-binding protein [Geminicoccaceae bacterium]|nr:BMP family ABC transporter substrate-binding protein [Geminicoccaceae bacterium]
MAHLGLSRRHLLGVAAAAGTAASLPRLARARDKVKAGFVYVGPVGDYGWTYQHDVGRKAVEEHYGDKVETSYVENVAEGPDAERVIQQLARAGNDIVFTTSFGFMNPTVKVAERFPDVMFEHATGYQTRPNLAVYNSRFYEGRDVIGTIAGHMSKTGKVGYVASFPIPEVVMGINAFQLAMRKIRPDSELKVVWVNSWYDPGKEADAAKTLIDQGCDIITQHTDSPAALQVCQERGVYGFGQASDMQQFAPEAHLTAIVDDWAPYYIERVGLMLEDRWETHNVWHGFKEGHVQMAPYNPVMGEEVIAAAEKIRIGIIEGTHHTFAGPIANQAGEVKVPEGENASDEMLLTMDWYVDGVQA